MDPFAPRGPVFHPAMTALEETLRHRFGNPALLEEALTHPSCTKTQKTGSYNNQRLEFLGDAVLGLVVAQLLFERYPHENEGDLAKRHAALVCGERLVEVARSIGLAQHIKMTPSEEISGGRQNPSNIEDACEAAIGALYLDGGLEAAARFIRAHWESLAESTATPPKDAKTALQEWAQGQALALPLYETIASEGPAHAPVFTIQVSVEGGWRAQASGASKRHAEHAAAKKLLDEIAATHGE